MSAGNLDVGELARLSADLKRTADVTRRQVRAVVTKGAINVKRDARQFASGIGHAPHYPRSITDDVVETADGYVAEVGPDKDLPQGPLGNILEYGTSKNAPIKHLEPALDREEPGFVRAMEQVAGGAL